MMLVVMAIILTGLYLGRSVLIPIAIAVLLAFVLTPLVRALRKVGLPSGAAVILIVTALIGVLIGGGYILNQQVKNLAGNMPFYETELRQKVRVLRGATTQSRAVKRAAETIRDLGRELTKTDQQSKEPSSSASQPAAEDENKATPVPVRITQPESTPLDTYKEIITTLLEPLAVIGLVFVYLTFILLQRQDLRDRLVRLAGVQDIDRTTTAMADAGDRLSRFFLLQSMINASYGVVVGVALWLIGVPNPVLWGGLAFLMRYVPYIGSIIAAAFPLILAAAVDPTWTTFLWTLSFYVIGESLMGQVVEPLAFGHNTGLSPLAVIIAATLWTSLWGPVGLVMAVPLTLVIVTMARHVDQFAFLNIMFGDEPALGPAERFYQRMLASDADEAAEICERYSKERSLLNCYDEVALNALRLAQSDADRDLLDSEKLDGIVDVISDVVDDMSFVENATDCTLRERLGQDGNNDEECNVRPLPVLSKSDVGSGWRSDKPVLVVAGRSALDRAAANLVKHVLDTHGLQCDLVGYRDLAGRRFDGVKAVILSHVSTKRHGAQVRSLAKRLGGMAPEALIIAGFWSDERESNQTAQESGTDHNVRTIRDALEICIEHATSECGSAEFLEAVN